MQGGLVPVTRLLLYSIPGRGGEGLETGKSWVAAGVAAMGYNIGRDKEICPKMEGA